MENEQERIGKLEMEINNLKRKVGTTRTDLTLKAVGAGAGALASYGFLGAGTRKFLDGVEEAVHALTTAAQIASVGKSSDYQDKYLREIDQSTREIYERFVADESHLTEASRESIEGVQRGSLKFPGQKTAPVESLKNAKGGIIQYTKGLFSNSERKKEIAQTNTPIYQQNYNELARLRVSALERRTALNGEMADLCEKIEKSRLNTGSLDKDGIQRLERLVGEYNQISGFLNEVGNIKVGEVFKGKESATYEASLQKAKEYNIAPFVPGSYGDAGVLGVTLLGAYIGNRISRPIRKIVNTAIKGASFAYKLARRKNS